MKVSKIVTMKNLDTGKNEEIKLDTKEIREFNFTKKDYIINKVLVDNLWLKIALILWILILIVLSILAKNGQSYDFLDILMATSLTTITAICNFDIMKLYFLGDNFFSNSIKKRSIISWPWSYAGKFGTPYTELERDTHSFLNKVNKEINKIAIRFYLLNLAIVLALLFIIVFLTIGGQSDENSLIFIVVMWALAEFYFYMLRHFVRAKAKSRYNITLRVDNGVKECLANVIILEARFLLNYSYLIEEEIKLSKHVKASTRQINNISFLSNKKA